MAVRRGARWALIATGALIVMIAAALIIAPPFVLRYALQHYLKAEGITADIGHVHADIFTGQISLDDVSGHGPDNRRFRIGHFAVNIDYWPLTDHHIDLSYIRLANAHIDAGRNARQQPTIAGVPIPLPSAGGGQHNWGFGVGEVAVDQVTLHYRAPTHGDQPAVDQTLVVHGLHLGPIATWQPQQATHAKVQLRVADGRLDLQGRLSPLGDTRRANLTLKASHFSMQAFMPVARLGYVTALDGRLDADQQLSMTYAADGRLTLGVKGRSAWHNAHLATTDGTDVRGDSLSWQGDEQATLWRNHSQPGHIHADGKVALADVVAQRANQLDFRQKSASWHGKADAKLGQHTTRVTSHGKLSAQDTHLVSGNWLKLSSAAEHLTGDLNLTLTPDETRVDTDGGFAATGMGFTVPETVDLNSATLNWTGKTTTRLAGNGTHIQTDGHLTSNQLVFDVPKTSHVTADHVAWQGQVAMHSAQLFSRRAKGQLEAGNVHLNIPGAPIRMSAAQFGFDGQYAEQPDASGRALRLTLSGAAHSHKLDAVDTAINAPWIELLQTNASGIAIDGLDAIRVADLKASGVRMLGDSHGDGAAIRAVSMQAKQFALRDLQHYRVHDLELGGANIHTRHDKHGIGVISQFVGSMTASNQASKPHAKASSPGAASGPGAASATYAVDHMHLSGPAIAFVDKTTTPAVHLTGSKLHFTLDNLDTAKPNQDAHYTLGLDVGAYGHLDSRGKIAPFAPHGIRMDLNAWLRSLALAPLSGYLDAAMGRRIANGVADGTLNLSATKGQLNGVLDTTLTNFRLANSATKETDIAYGISMNTALKLLRGHNDIIHFRTKILGDVTTPYFSINNLIREAVLAGLRTALLSNYSPLGLLNNAKNSFLNLFRSVEDRPAIFTKGKHYVRPADRKYLALIAKAMRSHPGWTLHLAGQAVPADAKALKLHGTPAAQHARLEQLARQRQSAVKDYLAARNVNPARIIAGNPSVVDSNKARPAVKFSLDKH
ncbi:DUF748 domain-containing protein [Salinisphaera sp. LB1]|uniref:DUF748 domain-containing protein n=1 Tax=Salinisphaera sp. LB1 TaxID=2183911 RepID=UPI000D708DFD|nr:DUF748 domain-containing protein [Salinisphaera sp. LB1]